MGNVTVDVECYSYSGTTTDDSIYTWDPNYPYYEPWYPHYPYYRHYIICPKCKGSIECRDHYCKHCGHQMIPKHCPHCGKEI